MEQQDLLRQFETIERKVQELISVCRSLESTNAEQRKTIERLEKELREKTEAEQSYTQERGEIRSRVEILLGKLGDLTQG